MPDSLQTSGRKTTFAVAPGQVLTKEGPVRVRVRGGQGSNNVLEVAIDYEHAEVPSRAYYADYCNVVRARADYAVIFGKLVTGTAALRSKIEIMMTPSAFVRQLWGTSTSVRKTLDERWQSDPLPAVENLIDTDKVQTFRANAVYVVTMGEESVLDFYFLPPTELHHATQGKRPAIALEAVIRVSLPSPLLHELFARCGQTVADLPNLDAILKGEGEE